MRVIRSAEFQPEQAWDALDTANMQGITTRLHWTDKPYKWHINDGEEVFVVLDGAVLMRYKHENQEMSVMLQVGDIFYAEIGTEHIAEPQPFARVLVVEKEGSV